MTNSSARKILQELAGKCPEWGIVRPESSDWWLITQTDGSGYMPCPNACLDHRDKQMMWALASMRTIRVAYQTYTVDANGEKFLAVVGQCPRCRVIYWLWRPHGQETDSAGTVGTAVRPDPGMP